MQSGKEDFKTRGFPSFHSFPPQHAKPSLSRRMQTLTQRTQRRRNGTRPRRVGPHAASAATPPPAAKQAANLEPTQFRILPRRAKGAAPALPGGQHGNQHPRPPRTQRRRNGARPRRVGPHAASAALPPPPPTPRSRRQKQRESVRFKILPRRAKGAAPDRSGRAARQSASTSAAEPRRAAPRPIVRPQPPAHRRSASPHRPSSAACAQAQRLAPRPSSAACAQAQRLAPAIARKQAQRPTVKSPRPPSRLKGGRFPRKSTCSRARKCGRMVSTTGSAGNLRRGETSCSTKNTENRIGM